MNYTELSVATQDVMPNKGVLFFKSGLSDFIQVGEPIQNEDGLTFVGKLDECGDTFCPNCSRKLVQCHTDILSMFSAIALDTKMQV